MDRKYLLGISCFYHDSAATLICDGEIVAAAQEERFSRIKHDASFPEQAIKFCLAAGNITGSELSNIVYYEKPLLKFDRLLETYFTFAPEGIRSFIQAIPVWLKEKLLLKSTLKREFTKVFNSTDFPRIQFSQHHLSHAASAYYPSPFKSAAVLCLDGVGEWATTTAWYGDNNELSPIWQINFPHSIGLLYSAVTQYLGFKVNSGEYKVMGLAPYGRPLYVNKFKDHLIDIKNDGSYRLNMRYFDYCTGLTMINKHFCRLFEHPVRQASEALETFHMDMAASLQVVIEEVVIKLASTLQKETQSKNLCLAGGVALNCVANGKLINSEIFENIWIQPAAGDAGGALGAALFAWHQNPGAKKASEDQMKGSFLGPVFKDPIEQLNQWGIEFTFLEEDKLTETVASLLAAGNVIGWHQDKMEYGPRALGNRSILADPRSTQMQKQLNLKIKYRESFRPFAPAVLEEDALLYFNLKQKNSPYMLLTANLLEKLHNENTKEENKNRQGLDKLSVVRSPLPAITHVDYSARVQTVSKETNPRFHKLIAAFKKQTGCPVLINTSFNVRGEPIVCSPEDALRCFTYTDMDHLVIGNVLITANQKPSLKAFLGPQPEFFED